MVVLNRPHSEADPLQQYLVKPKSQRLSQLAPYSQLPPPQQVRAARPPRRPRDCASSKASPPPVQQRQHIPHENPAACPCTGRATLSSVVQRNRIERFLWVARQGGRRSACGRAPPGSEARVANMRPQARRRRRRLFRQARSTGADAAALGRGGGGMRRGLCWALRGWTRGGTGPVVRILARQDEHRIIAMVCGGGGGGCGGDE